MLDFILIVWYYNYRVKGKQFKKGGKIMTMVMFFVAWLFEMPLWGYLCTMFLGFMADMGAWIIGEEIEKFLKKLKKRVDK